MPPLTSLPIGHPSQSTSAESRAKNFFCLTFHMPFYVPLLKYGNIVILKSKRNLFSNIVQTGLKAGLIFSILSSNRQRIFFRTLIVVQFLLFCNCLHSGNELSWGQNLTLEF